MELNGFSWDGFKEVLEDSHIFPDHYIFKFIVPREKKGKVMALFNDSKIIVRSSKSGKFVSITARCFVKSSEEVIAKYKLAAKIEGIVAL